MLYHIKGDLHLIVATGRPATFRPPHYILVSSPTDCPQLSSSYASPVQLAPAGIFLNNKRLHSYSLKYYTQLPFPIILTLNLIL
jgi:hypothetical protein